MYKVVGLDGNEVINAESFCEALKFFHEHCIRPIAQGKTFRNSETTCYIEAKGGNSKCSHVTHIPHVSHPI